MLKVFTLVLVLQLATAAGNNCTWTSIIPMEVIAFLSPPPLSPHFTSSGSLAGWNEDLTLIAGVMLLLALLDVLIVRNLIRPKARFFALHAVANAIAACAAFPDVWRVYVVDIGGGSWTGASHTMVANSAIAAIHLYHCVAFDLKRADIFHHLTFVVILCGLAIPYKNVGGCANNLGCFFLSGLPGGIDFVNLVLKEHGIMTKLEQKRWAAFINTWMRGPSMSVYAFVGWQTYMTGINNEVPAFFVFLICFLHFFNGQHYCAEAVAGHAKWKEREHVRVAAAKGE